MFVVSEQTLFIISRKKNDFFSEGKKNIRESLYNENLVTKYTHNPLNSVGRLVLINTKKDFLCRNN